MCSVGSSAVLIGEKCCPATASMPYIAVLLQGDDTREWWKWPAQTVVCLGFDYAPIQPMPKQRRLTSTQLVQTFCNFCSCRMLLKGRLFTCRHDQHASHHDVGSYPSKSMGEQQANIVSPSRLVEAAQVTHVALERRNTLNAPVTGAVPQPHSGTDKPCQGEQGQKRCNTASEQDPSRTLLPSAFDAAVTFEAVRPTSKAEALTQLRQPPLLAIHEESAPRRGAAGLGPMGFRFSS